MAEPTLSEREFVGRFGLFTEMAGQSRVRGLLTGWLLICDPAHQSITELSSALDISKASVSTVIRQLQQAKMVERHPVAGTRQHYYRLAGGGWVDILRSRWEFIPLGRRISEDGLALVAQDPQRRHRIEEYVDFLSFMEDELDELIVARWQKYRSARIKERESQ